MRTLVDPALSGVAGKGRPSYRAETKVVEPVPADPRFTCKDLGEEGHWWRNIASSVLALVAFFFVVGCFVALSFVWATASDHAASKKRGPHAAIS
jgi:hypothetical protein